MKLPAVLGVFAAGLALGALGGYLVAPQTRSVISGTEVLDPEKLRGEIVASSEAEKKTYKSSSPVFSVSYPKDLVVKEFDEGQGATTIVFQGPGEDNGFQLFITPYAGETIAEDRIKKDLKGAPMLEPKQIVIGSNTDAALFTSESPMIGESREVWFIKDGYLYEATTYAVWESKLAEVLATVSFP